MKKQKHLVFTMLALAATVALTAGPVAAITAAAEGPETSLDASKTDGPPVLPPVMAGFTATSEEIAPVEEDPNYQEGILTGPTAMRRFSGRIRTSQVTSDDPRIQGVWITSAHGDDGGRVSNYYTLSGSGTWVLRPEAEEGKAPGWWEGEWHWDMYAPRGEIVQGPLYGQGVGEGRGAYRGMTIEWVQLRPTVVLRTADGFFEPSAATWVGRILGEADAVDVCWIDRGENEVRALWRVTDSGILEQWRYMWNGEPLGLDVYFAQLPSSRFPDRPADYRTFLLDDATADKPDATPPYSGYYRGECEDSPTDVKLTDIMELGETYWVYRLVGVESIHILLTLSQR
jgi:hypothetical protein